MNVSLRPQTDADGPLVERTLAGDLDAFETLVERHRDVVFRVAARIVGREAAEDVSQDAFLRAFHRLERFRGDAPFRSWLLQITHHAAVDAATRRRVEVDDAEAAADAPEGDRQRLPAMRLEQREQRQRLEAKLQRLSPPHRAVLVLRDLEGFTYEEIAGMTESPLGTVKGRLHRARGELIELLRANTYDWELPR